MPVGGVMKEYQVGQILYLISDASRVIPIQVIEEVVRTTLEGRELTYNIKFPDKKETIIDIKKIKGELFDSQDLAKNYMINNATQAINQMIETAEEIAINIFNKNAEEHSSDTISFIETNQEAQEEKLVQLPKSDDIIKVDLGNGRFGKLKANELDKAGTQ
tara:strand:- start:983 stop:1465 length:483 start_codon:yes stop_codon:yes gene_type:complete